MQVNLYMPNSYDVLTIQEKELWSSYLQQAVIYDVYHTWYYHSLEKEGDPFLFVYHKNDSFIALPLLKRKIADTSFYDCTSVYGYAGPVSNILFENMEDDMITGFKQSFSNFLKRENIVSVFSRLHPIINQQLLLDRLGGIYENGKTVAIDLQPSMEEQRAKYRRAIRQKVNQLRKKGFIVKEATEAEEKAAFVRIYNETMIKVDAASDYFFGEKYIFDLLQNQVFDSKLLLAYYKDKITSGVLVTLSNNIMQLHLAATANEFLSESPMKLLFDEARILAKHLGMRYLHLGGGVGGAEDSLFNFKAGFSDLFFSFNTWRYVSDLSVYHALVEEKCRGKELNPNKFPLYRF